MKRITLADCKISISAETELISPVGMFDSGNAELDRQIENEIFAVIDNGDVWGWCTVEVKLTYKSLTASDYLGACSYKDEHEFITDSGYYEGMLDNCLTDLNNQLTDLLAD